MTVVTRRYRFSASHRLNAPDLDAARNRELYGKCNNPYGHGHNYVLDVSVRGPVDARTGRAVDVRALDDLVRKQVLNRFDHRNLNTEIDSFQTVVPTSENLGREIYRRLAASWRAVFPSGSPILEKVTIAETARNIFEVGHEIE